MKPHLMIHCIHFTPRKLESGGAPSSYKHIGETLFKPHQALKLNYQLTSYEDARPRSLLQGQHNHPLHTLLQKILS